MLVLFFFLLDLSVSNIEQSLPQNSYFVEGNFAVKIFLDLCSGGNQFVGGERDVEKVFAKVAENRICGAKNTCNMGKGST